MVRIQGRLQSLQVYQCYQQCSVNAPCPEGDTACAANCNGHISGFDGPDSNALCLPRAELQAMCDLLDDCESIDAHRTLNRGFLNGAGCSANQELLGTDANYDWYVKSVTAVPGGARRATASGRRLLTTTELEWGFSWSQVLRFRDIKFATGGTFKLCFCDSEHLDADSTQDTASLGGLPTGTYVAGHPATQMVDGETVAIGTVRNTNHGTSALVQVTTGQFRTVADGDGALHVGGEVVTTAAITASTWGNGRSCNAVGDYSIEVGTIHVSGVSCLLQDVRFRRVTCKEQLYKGIRCYRPPMVAPVLTPPVLDDTVLIGELTASAFESSNVASWCLYGPEEVTQNDPRCQLVAAYQSTR